MNPTTDLKTHWNSAYGNEDSQLGWFESDPEQTMRLIEKCNLSKEATILNVGAGTTLLIDALLDKGYSNIIANDLSELALEKLKERILKKYSYSLPCITDDLTNPKELTQLQDIDLWIDRAVLHFFLKEKEQDAYFNLIKKIVSKGGYVLIAVFALDGAPKCCGLDLRRYDLNMLQNQLGNEFKLIEAFNYMFINPSGGERPYVYSLFKRL
jgi:cyclopropane fatty-acyl-phospholipid synthase-like methyltransferase